MALTKFYWSAQPAITEALVREFADCLGPGKLVVDVGAGYAPWEHATEFVDREAWPQLAGRKVHALDVELDRLPYADKSVDFLYCRHTIEDLHNPTLLLREMNRVAKAGYVETPSPLAEMCRGINRTPLRGYQHHYWFSWVSNGTLMLMPKMPIVEHTELHNSFDAKLLEILDCNPLFWNTYLTWRHDLRYEVQRHRLGFDAYGDFLRDIQAAINASIADSELFCFHKQLQSAVFYPSSPPPASSSPSPQPAA
jgi:SAM-dependent methyltransferase